VVGEEDWVVWVPPFEEASMEGDIAGQK